MLAWLWRNLGDDWLVSARAATLFRVSTILVLASLPIFLGYVHGEMSTWKQVVWGTEGVLGAPAIFFLWSGMWRYWARIDHSSIWVKRFWFTVLLIGFWCGSVFYCYFVYLPQIRRKGFE
jgi:hypothetical protein